MLATGFAVSPLDQALPFGVCVSGLERASLQDEAVRQRLFDLWIQHGVILFRDGETSQAMHLELSRCFGPLEPHPFPETRSGSEPDLVKVKFYPDDGTYYDINGGYDRFCKRPCFHDDYLPTFNRPNVTLVDTQGHGVDRITPTGVIANGREYPLDCLIYSTGYDASSPFAKRISFDIVGNNGLTLKDKWANGALTFHGYGTHGFPNLFIMAHVQTGLSLNFPHMIGEQARHIAYILHQARNRGATRIAVTQQAEDAWVAQIDAAAISMVEALRECTPSYFNHEGDVSRLNARNSPYGAGPMAFYKIIADWRDEGSLAGLDLAG